MSNNNNQENPIELIKEAINIILNNPDSIKDLKDIKNLLELRRKLDNAIISFLEYKKQDKELEEADKKIIEKEYSKIIRKSVSDLLADIVNIGYMFRDSLGEDFRKMGYRILESIRSGEKSDVEYLITRIFISNGKNIPNSLIRAFDPAYDINVFKTFMYAFLASIIEIKEKEE
ncbi:MAG: hypothetical protein QW156_04960 [Candidatus Aenigmatarchaeota archaeon]